MRNYYMTVVMGVAKRCVASGRALPVESAASEIKRLNIHLRKTLQNQSKCMHERRFAAMSLLQLSSDDCCRNALWI